MAEKTRACNDSSCSKESCGNCEKNPESFYEKTNEYNSIKKVIGVVSGKGRRWKILGHLHAVCTDEQEEDIPSASWTPILPALQSPKCSASMKGQP